MEDGRQQSVPLMREKQNAQKERSLYREIGCRAAASAEAIPFLPSRAGKLMAESAIWGCKFRQTRLALESSMHYTSKKEQTVSSYPTSLRTSTITKALLKQRREQ
jgi:hypothetical protein